ncbi:hypothetical protein HK100_000177 [Physocladia obscura]|uniref:Uncharacterized protein n=1 Tax=Physocladia obscura TaxID=109957 RepID=A0AAD5T9K8_9FUNG|nr:hypothetical protein HK100_000177 [Physocladia obscura]
MSETKQSVSAVDAQGLGVGLGVKVEVGFEVEVGSEGSGVEAAVRACALRMIGRNAYSVASTCQPLGLNALLVRHWLFTASQTPRVSLPELQPGREEDENDTDDTDDDDDEHEAQEDSQERVSVSRARLEPLGHVSVTVTRSSTETQTGTRTRTRRRQYLAALDAALLPPRVFDGLLARLLVYGTPPLNLLDEHVLAVVCATLCAALSVFAACDPASVTARCHSLFAQLTHLARLGDKPLPSLLEHLRTDLLAHAAMLANPLMSPFANIKRFTLDIIYAELKAILDSHSVPTNTSRHRVAAKKLDKVALAALFQVRLSDAGIQFDFSRTEFLKEAFDCMFELNR